MTSCSGDPSIQKCQWLTLFPVFTTVGGAFFISAAQCGFNDQVIKELAKSLPEIDPATVLGIGATQIRVAFTASQIPAVLAAYMSGLRAIFTIAVGAYGLATMIGMLGNWSKIDAKALQKAAGEAA